MAWHLMSSMKWCSTCITVLVTNCLHDSDEFHIILLKVSVIACKIGCRLAVPLPRTTCTDSTKGFKFLWMTDMIRD